MASSCMILRTQYASVAPLVRMGPPVGRERELFCHLESRVNTIVAGRPEQHQREEPPPNSSQQPTTCRSLARRFRASFCATLRVALRECEGTWRLSKRTLGRRKSTVGRGQNRRYRHSTIEARVHLGARWSLPMASRQTVGPLLGGLFQ